MRFVDSNGDRHWYEYDGDDRRRHRANGPACEHADGYKAWYLNGQRHRVGGPAIERPDGVNTWWVHGVRKGRP